MAAKSGELEAPLLDCGSSPPPSSNGSTARKISAWMLRVLMWIAFLAWILVLLAFPAIKLGPGRSSSSPALGTGIVLLLFAAPVLSLVLLATIYLEIRIKSVSTAKKRQAKISLWTCPCLVDGLLGVVSAAEALLIVAFVGYLVWCLAIYLINDSDLVQRFMKLPAIREKFQLWELWTYVIGLRIGFLGLFCLGFLLLPVARGSPLLRLIDIPFEHAVKYHVWLGHLTMAIFTIHGLCYVVVWTVQGRFEELIAWQRIGVANLPGEISLAAGLLLWMTSFGYIRQAFFELFFYTHQLYVVFFVFMAFHIGELAFCISMAGFFLFMLDRFLRFCQSRRSVDVLVSRVLPCGTIEIALSKPQDLNYNALSFIFLSFPKLSFLQWHPFSVSSSPYDARGNMSFLIKPLGSWTDELQNLIKEANKGSACPMLGVEGPYGHESDYYLKYEALVLVAGGIGVSPFIAILRDILHRYNMNHRNLPKEVTLIWAVKYSKELGIINLVQPEFICPEYPSRLKLTIHAFVTREFQPDSEEATPLPEHILSFPKKPDGKPVSTLAGTYSNLWMGVYIAVSAAGFFLIQTILEKFFLGPVTLPTEGAAMNTTSVSWTVRAAALLLSMTCGVVVFGGLVIAWWNWIERSRKGRKSGCQESIIAATGAGDKVGVTGPQLQSLVGPWNTIYGNRPDLKGIFASFAKKWSGINVGVLVCGPQTLQTSVAAECRANNVKFGSVAFHYHSVSFDL